MIFRLIPKWIYVHHYPFSMLKTAIVVVSMPVNCRLSLPEGLGLSLCYSSGFWIVLWIGNDVYYRISVLKGLSNKLTPHLKWSGATICGCLWRARFSQGGGGTCMYNLCGAETKDYFMVINRCYSFNEWINVRLKFPESNCWLGAERSRNQRADAWSSPTSGRNTVAGVKATVFLRTVWAEVEQI